MMQVQFNRPVTIGKETYGKGQHSVPDEDVKDNWFFDALVKEGSAVVLRQDDAAEEVPEAAPEAQAEAPAEAEAQAEAPAAKPTGKKGK
jgi:hypothetical protein